MKWYYYPVKGLWYSLSLLPLRALYLLSDALVYPLVYYIIRYRRELVKRQLRDCFPERDEAELQQITHRYYHYFSDYVVETLKMMSMSREEMARRVEWIGLEELQKEMERDNKTFALAYLGHYGNWEWLSSFSLGLRSGFQGAQIYHPLKNRDMDGMFLQVRERWGGRCIPMKETLRHILRIRQEGKREVIGFIADQSPKWEAMHQWCQFLHHDTSFFIGTESIAKRVDGSVYYVDVTRPCRGYYRAEVKLITNDPKSFSDFEITDRYAELLEQGIQREPHLWLWTHNRWKRSKSEWSARNRK